MHGERFRRKWLVGIKAMFGSQGIDFSDFLEIFSRLPDAPTSEIAIHAESPRAEGAKNTQKLADFFKVNIESFRKGIEI